MNRTNPFRFHAGLGIIAVSVAVFWAMSSSGWARPFKIWSYEELIETADTVVVVEVIKSTPAPEPLPIANATGLEGVHTRFKVLGSLKGSAKAGEEITVLHNKYSDQGMPVINGYLFIQFPEGERLVEIEVKDTESGETLTGSVRMTSQWLAFLAKGDDGLYRPITSPDLGHSFKPIGPSDLLPRN